MTSKQSIKICSVKRCNLVVRTGPYCNKHYIRMRRHGTTELKKPILQDKAYYRDYYRRNHERLAEYHRERYHAGDKTKNIARGAVARAVKTGKIPKPVLCQFCGSYKPLDGHHKNYSRKLHLQWLCRVCHKSVHHG